MRRCFGWSRRHPWRTLGLVVAVAFVALNVLAYQHAHAMTHFVEQGGWTRKPEGGWDGRPESLSWAQRAGLLIRGVRILRPIHDATPADLDLAYEEHTVPGPAGELAAWFVPHDEPRGIVVLCHGYAACKARLVPEIAAFADLGYSSFAFDFRGCGGSAGAETTIGYREAADVAAAVAYVRARWPGQPVLLFGQSMGSAAILRALATGGARADVAILECPFDRMGTAVRARFRAVKAPAFPTAELLLFWGSVQLKFNAFAHNPVEYAKGVRCPVLLMHGAIDSRVRQDEVREIFANLPGEKRLHLFDGVGHQSYVRCRPEVWQAQVSEFLSSTRSQAGPPPEGSPKR